MDWTRQIQIVFTCLITLQFIVVVSHDLVDIPGWTHGSQVRSIIGRRKLWLATLANIRGIDLEAAVAQKYGVACPGCGSIPCVCDPAEKP